MVTCLISISAVLLSVLAVCVFSNYYYWKGKLSGWDACEKMVQDRADRSPKLDKKLVWTELLE